MFKDNSMAKARVQKEYRLSEITLCKEVMVAYIHGYMSPISELKKPLQTIKNSKFSHNPLLQSKSEFLNRFQMPIMFIHKSMGPDRKHPRVLRDLVDVIAKLFSIIFERSWRTREVPEDWRKSYVMPVFKKGKKEDPENYRPVSLTSIHGKLMEQLILDVIPKHDYQEAVMLNWKTGTVPSAAPSPS
ncbi:rna-directed dna polymerase from mobile element hypothetical protein [Limosa lapponica baueri]|uniref:Rna-directed dna polymerase from mobile element jockey-like n=1 Tax=Limosa lapponica baueri TaxID=1758121 RepID=A0A2I0U6I4_LIMLA|nr:rna-directed dna polymerase from mobile element hypothetical protein [Limosa lapponica baueri]